MLQSHRCNGANGAAIVVSVTDVIVESLTSPLLHDGSYLSDMNSGRSLKGTSGFVISGRIILVIMQQNASCCSLSG